MLPSGVQSTASSFAHLLAASTVVHMASLPVPRPNNILPSISIPEADKLRQELGKCCSQRDRMLQQTKASGEVWKKNKQLIKRMQNRIKKMKDRMKSDVTMKDVSVRMRVCVSIVIVCMLFFGITLNHCHSFHCMLRTCRSIVSWTGSKFADCPWPLPPSAILLCAPIHEIPGQKTSEELLRKMHGNDKILKYNSAWQFVNGPRPQFT